jgi:hypothetical protein
MARDFVYRKWRNPKSPIWTASARVIWVRGGTGHKDRRRNSCPFRIFVFTLPEKIGRQALQNAEEVYRILFRAASETLLTIAADPRRLGANIGFLAGSAHLGTESSSASFIFIAWFPAEALVRMDFAGPAAEKSRSSCL